MTKYLMAFVIIISFFSCDAPKRPIEKENDLTSIYNGLKKDRVFTKFIGYHIVRRDNENYFMHRNLKIDSSDFVVPNFRANEGTKDYNGNALFFKQNPDAKLQFDIMRRYGVKAIATLNYNGETKQLEYSDSMGYDFNKYELSFMLSDSIEITHINFDTTEYFRLIKNNYELLEKLDTNWFVLKR